MADGEEKNLPYPNSLSGLFLTFLALSGEVPVDLIDRLSQSKRYREKVLQTLKQKRFVRAYVRNGLRGLRLSTAAKKLLLAADPERFTPYLTGVSETNRLKSEVPRRLRLHRMAEVLVTMYNAGVLVFPWEKPALFQHTPPTPPCRVTQPVYYSSREIKGLGKEAAQIRGSRATGLLLSPRTVFAVYNTGDAQVKWEYKAEMRLKALLQIEICQKRLPARYATAELSAIVIGAGMEMLDTLLGVGDGVSGGHFVLDRSYPHFYFLPASPEGEAVLRLLCDSEIRATLDAILMEDLSPPIPNAAVENDAMDGDVFVLFGYTCDLPRLRNFDSALQINSRKGCVICFDFQRAAYRRCLHPDVRLVSIDLAACERRVLSSPENKSSCSR